MKKRIYAVDVLRGLTLCAMIIANCKIGEQNFAQLNHAEWFGLTFVDLIFPTFLTIVGISMYFSLSKFSFKLSGKSAFKIVSRTLLLIACAYIVYIINKALGLLIAGEPITNIINIFATFRITGILVRIAVCYCIAAFVVLLVPNKKWVIGIIIALLAGYWVILLCCNGLEHSSENGLGIFDTMLLSENHIYRDGLADGTKINFDPEGIVSNIPCVAQILLGFLASSVLLKKNEKQPLVIAKLFVYGFSLMIAGFVCSFFLDYSKKIWTPSFCLLTAGVAICMLALFVYILDYKGYKKWGRFFEVFGVNCLFGFLIYGIINNIIILTGFKTFFYEGLVTLTNFPEVVSLMYCIIIMLVTWAVMYPLYRKRIYIKL